jgi:hypothetical protein
VIITFRAAFFIWKQYDFMVNRDFLRKNFAQDSWGGGCILRIKVKC